jgi:hypothetical protein
MKIRKRWLIFLLGLCCLTGAFAGGLNAFLTPQEEEALFKGKLQSVDRLNGTIAVNRHTFRLTRSTRIYLHNGEPTSSWNLRPGMQVGLVVAVDDHEDEPDKAKVAGVFDLVKVVILRSTGH